MAADEPTPPPPPDRDEEEPHQEVFEDTRIEPFFGPRRLLPGPSSPEDANGSEPETSSPLRRLTGKAIEGARNGAQRILNNGTAALNGRKPLLYVKNGKRTARRPSRSTMTRKRKRTKKSSRRLSLRCRSWRLRRGRLRNRTPTTRLSCSGPRR